MNPVLSSILTGGMDKVVGAIGTVLDNLFTTKEEKAQAELAKLQLLLTAEQARAQLSVDLEKAYMADMANLREQIKIEMQSDDWFVRRARPFIIWLGGLILAFNLMMVPAVQGMLGEELEPFAMPEEFWYVWGTLVVGYSILRTIDKRGSNAANRSTG